MAFNRVERIKDRVTLRRALVSVYDKAGLEPLALGLAEACPGIEILSTGGSFEALSGILSRTGAAFKLVAVSSYTGQKEMAGGLVKTLDWKIYLGLLAEPGNADHEADLEKHGAWPIDMVVGDLYPFEAAARSASAPIEELRQRIDIGGPTMIRAAAKNFLRVVSVSSPRQYGELVGELKASGGATGLEFRRRLAAAAFERVAAFDAAIADRMAAMTRADLAAAYRVD